MSVWVANHTRLLVDRRGLGIHELIVLHSRCVMGRHSWWSICWLSLMIAICRIANDIVSLLNLPNPYVQLRFWGLAHRKHQSLRTYQHIKFKHRSSGPLNDSCFTSVSDSWLWGILVSAVHFARKKHGQKGHYILSVYPGFSVRDTSQFQCSWEFPTANHVTFPPLIV